MNRVARNATPTPHAPPPVSPRRNKTKSCALRLSTDARSDRGLKPLSRPEPSTSIGGATPRGRPSGRSRGGSVGGVVKKTSPGVAACRHAGPPPARPSRAGGARVCGAAPREGYKPCPCHVRRDPELRDAAAFGRPRRSSLRTNPYDYPARLKPSPLWRTYRYASQPEHTIRDSIASADTLTAVAPLMRMYLYSRTRASRRATAWPQHGLSVADELVCAPSHRLVCSKTTYERESDGTPLIMLGSSPR